MIRIMVILVAAAATLALPAFDVGEAMAGDDNGDEAYCHWYRQQARNTSDEYWWDRWRRCLRGDDWDQPRPTFRPRGAPVWEPTHVEWCRNRYRSYDPGSNTFLGYDGHRHRCNSPLSGKRAN